MPRRSHGPSRTSHTTSRSVGFRAYRPARGAFLAILLLLLHPPQHLREGHLGKRPEKRMRPELAAAKARGGEAGQEAGEGSRVGQLRDLAAEGGRAAQTHFVEVDGFRGEELGGVAAVLAPGAVAAGVGEVLSEVGG